MSQRTVAATAKASDAANRSRNRRNICGDYEERAPEEVE